MEQRVEDKLVVTSFTDPVCTWCWGTEPVFRRLETRFPGKVVIRYVMGGLVKDAREMQEPANGIGAADMDAFNRQVASHWAEASARHGMPVDADGFHLFSDELPSTYPQNIACKAAALASPERAEAFLYNLRAASAAEVRMTSRDDVLMQVADESGVDIAGFVEHFADGSAEKAFKGDLALAAGLGVHGFPTFIVKYNGQEVMLGGYRPYEVFEAMAARLSGGALEPVDVEPTRESLLGLARRRERLAGEEIRQALGLPTVDAAEELAAPLVAAGELIRQDAGNGWFVSVPKAVGATCDLVTGVCS